MLDSFWPLILPSFFAQPYNVFLFRQFFVSIPDSIDEAAMLDGCSRWQAFWKVIVPLGKRRFSLPSASCLSASGGTNCSLRWYTSTPKTSSR
ncbi:MAG: ABC transporter permease subunit [Bifidobacterium pseudocatenulatum]